MINPKISIIVVVFNNCEAFSKTLNNILDLKYHNYELIVIDGNSTDGTKDVIINNSYHIDKWISENDNGIYDAMNKGLNLATGDYVWYINAGDYIYDSYVLNNIFDGNDKIYDIYYGDTLITNEDGDILGLRKKRLPKKLTWRSFKKGMVVCHQSILIKRSIAGKYDTNYKYSADFKWVLEALKKAKSTYNSNEIISVFSTGGATTKHHKESLRERYAIMKDYYGGFETIKSHIRFVFDALKPKYRKFTKIWDENPFNKQN